MLHRKVLGKCFSSVNTTQFSKDSCVYTRHSQSRVNKELLQVFKKSDIERRRTNGKSRRKITFERTILSLSLSLYWSDSLKKGKHSRWILKLPYLKESDSRFLWKLDVKQQRFQPRFSLIFLASAGVSSWIQLVQTRGIYANLRNKFARSHQLQCMYVGNWWLK